MSTRQETTENAKRDLYPVTRKREMLQTKRDINQICILSENCWKKLLKNVRKKLLTRNDKNVIIVSVNKIGNACKRWLFKFENF